MIGLVGISFVKVCWELMYLVFRGFREVFDMEWVQERIGLGLYVCRRRLV